MDKKDLVKQWKPELKFLGFVFKDNMFRYTLSEEQPLQFGISVQKNTYAETFKINPAIVAKNPFTVTPQLILMGNVRPDGISLHVFRDSWWGVEGLPRALQSLRTYALSWFEKNGKPAYLAEMFEQAIAKSLT